MWQQAGDHLKKNEIFNVLPLLWRTKRQVHSVEDARTRGADIGRNAREEMTQTRASASPSQMKLFQDKFTW